MDRFYQLEFLQKSEIVVIISVERSEHKTAIMISYLSMINNWAGFYMKTHDERRMRGAVSVPGLILQDNDDP